MCGWCGVCSWHDMSLCVVGVEYIHDIFKLKVYWNHLKTFLKKWGNWACQLHATQWCRWCFWVMARHGVWLHWVFSITENVYFGNTFITVPTDSVLHSNRWPKSFRIENHWSFNMVCLSFLIFWHSLLITLNAVLYYVSVGHMPACSSVLST